MSNSHLHFNFRLVCFNTEGTSLKFTSEQIQGLTTPQEGQKVTGCYCSANKIKDKVKLYCGHSLIKGKAQTDVCHPEGMYRCMGPNFNAILLEDCIKKEFNTSYKCKHKKCSDLTNAEHRGMCEAHGITDCLIK